MANDVDFELYTDGACSGNPGPGGWGYLLRRTSDGSETKVAGAELQTTNNRMEMLSVIRGLEETPAGASILLITDSQYVVKGIDEWMVGWKANGWRRKDGRRLVPIKNEELWQSLDALLMERKVRCTWVRGHAGHLENEECDRMAVEAYQRLLRDGRG